MGLLLLAAVLLPFYLVGLGIYRLYFHPLAGVPGPKFAALTQWYESYFELFHKGLGGQYTFRIRQLHEEYGPIVRISPGEVHIDDPDFYSNIYTYKRGLDKPASLQWRFGAPSALFSTPRHDVHKMRRAAQDPFFSKRRIAQLAPQIQSKADKMCSRLARDFVGGDSGKKPVSLDNMFASYIADVTTQYSFDRDFDWLGHKDFESPFLKVIRGFKDIAHPCTQFPSLARVMTAVMKLMIKLAPPSMSLVLEFQEDMRKMVIGAQEDLKSREKGDLAGDETTDKTIVHGILKSGLPEEELDLDLLKDHAVSLIGAGIASAQWTLTVAFFHIIADRQVYETLRKELDEAIPDPNDPPSLEGVLEKLPYLMACVEEAVRLACGQMTRSPRISPDPITYDSYTLPAGTLISLDTWHMHHNETLYPDSFTFRPDRWLGRPKAPAPYDSRPLKHYMVSFGKGTRHCLGMNLAYAEITIAVASLVRRFDFELFETTYEDVRVVRDLIAPDVSRQSKGVRALVKDNTV